MKDRIITLLRQNDGEPYNNRHLARFIWAFGTVIAFMVVYAVVSEFLIPSGSTSQIPSGAIQEWAKVTFSLAAAAIFTGSLVYPTRRIEGWLDEHYPDHVAESELDYSVRSDLAASTWLGGLWGFRLTVGYAVISILVAMLSILNAMVESGFQLESAEVTRMTVLNSFAIATLTTLLAGVALLWLINWSMKDTVEELNTPSNNTFGTVVSIDRPTVTDGGEDDGA